MKIGKSQKFRWGRIDEKWLRDWILFYISGRNGHKLAVENEGEKDEWEKWDVENGSSFVDQKKEWKLEARN